MTNTTGTNRSNYRIINVLGQQFKVRVLTEEEDRERERLLKENKEKDKLEKLKRLKINSLMDKRFENCTFDNFKVTTENYKYKNLALKYATKFKRMREENIGLLIYGVPGTGKSYLSFCIANYLLDKSVSVIATTSARILQRLRELSSFGQEGTDGFLRTLQNVELLIIDDLGAEEINPWAKAKLYEIIDFRYRAEKPLIITTNLDLKTLEQRLTGQDGVTRTFDRIAEMCQPFEVRVTPLRKSIGQDKRKLFEDIIKKD